MLEVTRKLSERVSELETANIELSKRVELLESHEPTSVQGPVPNGPSAETEVEELMTMEANEVVHEGELGQQQRPQHH